MVKLNNKKNTIQKDKKFAPRDTSYSSFWLYNKEKDLNSEHFKDSFVNFYNDKELLSEFNPTIAKNIISFWSEPKNKILDPFSGRTRALVSYAMDREYTGYEISKDVVNYMTERFKNLNLLNKKDFNIKIHNSDCLNVCDDYKNEKFDLIFSCPPYYNLEKYESCKGQLTDIKNYDDFLTALMIRLLRSWALLKKGGFMCLVVGDFRRKGIYYPFHSDLIQMFDRCNDANLHDIIVIQNIPFNIAAFYFGGTKKRKYTAKSHEYLLVWEKI